MDKKIALRRLVKLHKSYICNICGQLLADDAYSAEIHMNHKHPDITLEYDWFDKFFRNVTLYDVIYIVKQDWKITRQYNPKCKCFYCRKAREFYKSQKNKSKSEENNLKTVIDK